jgi:thiol:disulfide interchange protein
MDKNKKLVNMSLALGVIALLGLALSVLALNDIGQGTEPDLSGEWMVVRLAYLFVLMFIALSMITLWRLSYQKGKKQ